MGPGPFGWPRWSFFATARFKRTLRWSSFDGTLRLSITFVAICLRFGEQKSLGRDAGLAHHLVTRANLRQSIRLQLARIGCLFHQKRIKKMRSRR